MHCRRDASHPRTFQGVARGNGRLSAAGRQGLGRGRRSIGIPGPRAPRRDGLGAISSGGSPQGRQRCDPVRIDAADACRQRRGLPLSVAERVETALAGQGARQAVPGLSGKNWGQHAAGAQMDPGGHPVFDARSQMVHVETALSATQHMAVPSGAVLQKQAPSGSHVWRDTQASVGAPPQRRQTPLASHVPDPGPVPRSQVAPGAGVCRQVPWLQVSVVQGSMSAQPLPQVPQLVGSFWRSVSQPVASFPSQLANPGAHVETKHAPLWQRTAVAWGREGQAAPHAPQWSGSLARSRQVPLQSVHPGEHVVFRHCLAQTVAQSAESGSPTRQRAPVPKNVQSASLVQR
jgi:hypothetical protein